MARPRSYNTRKVEEYQSIDLADLRRWRMLASRDRTRIPAVTWSTPEGLDQLGVLAEPSGVTFIRHRQGHLEKMFIAFAYSATEFGGRRAWFRCPGCGGRCRVLYGTDSLRCRKCRGLKYQSQYETPAFRMLERARKIRRRLGKSGGAGDPLPAKPRYMHWKKYRRLEWLVIRLESAGWEVMRGYTAAVSLKLERRRRR
jgi:hypothetical protein